MNNQPFHSTTLRYAALGLLLIGLGLPNLCFAAIFPPVITTQPSNQVVFVQQSATFQVVATGTAPLYYQWFKNGTKIPGANASSYTIAQCQTNDQASYSVIITNIVNPPAISSNATLTVIIPTPPTITNQPVNQFATIGGTATFAVQASGNGNP